MDKHLLFFFFFFQAEDGIRDHCVTGVQTCALPISIWAAEVLDENRFIAARDGMDGELIDVDTERRIPAREMLDRLLEACRPHADGDDRLPGLVESLADQFTLC